MRDDDLLGVLHETVDAVRAALSVVVDWAPRTERLGQYEIDVVADAAVLDLLLPSGLGVLSEESGLHHGDREVVVVVDPVDGSTNASRGIPWYATSLCAVDGDGPLAAVVANQASGERFEAVRGGGARLDGRPLAPSACKVLEDALVASCGVPDRHWGWDQARVLGAAALDLCAVAGGRLDAYVVATEAGLAPWDYLGGLLVCREAGAVVAEARGRDLVVLEHAARRSPLAAATPGLLAEVMAIPVGSLDDRS